MLAPVNLSHRELRCAMHDSRQLTTPDGPSIEEIYSLANRGFSLFPCKPRTKIPAIKQWPKLATRDTAQIEAWSNQFYGCNWGIAAWKSGLFALDVDRKTENGKLVDGFEVIATWSLEHPETLEWLRTATIQTSRGTQYLFAYPADRKIPNSAGLLAAGIDIRGHHGYIMAPGSIHPDGPVYEWATQEPIALPPLWLLNKISAAHSHSAAISDRPIPNASEQRKVSYGSRNSTLTSLAGTMRRRGMVEAAIEAALLVVNSEQCEPPLPEAEVRTIARSVSRYEPGETPLKPSPPAGHSLIHIRTAEDIPDPRSLSREPVRFLVDDLIPLNSVTVIAGEYAVGKSWLGLKLASEIKRGGRFIGRDVTRCDQVVYFDRENPLSVVQERMDLLYCDDEKAHRHWGLWCEDEPPLLESSALLDFGGNSIVMFFDTLVRFHRADENRPSEMAQVMGYLRRLQSRGATVIVFHHRDKKLEAGYRGSGEIPSGCDVLYSLSKEEGNLVLHAVKARMQVDQLVTFRAEWNEGRVEPCESSRAQEKRALVDEIRQQIRRNPGISQSRIVENINATLVRKISRWQIQQILEQHDGALWRVERGPAGSKTAYDLFTEKEFLIGGISPFGDQQVVARRPVEPAADAVAGVAPNISITSNEPADPADKGQQVFPTEPADLPPTCTGGRSAGVVAEAPQRLARSCGNGDRGEDV
jgi:Bifunctional DNA primase/polymerase, N-terminal/AAA domain/Primase C terminal 1 (PriCT-1)